jgi:hypothetical protein
MEAESRMVINTGWDRKQRQKDGKKFDLQEQS